MSKKDGSRFDTLFSEAGASRTDLSPSETEDALELGSTTPSSKRTTKSTDPDYTRTTIYLPKEMHRQIKVAAIVEDREMSDLIAEAIGLYFSGI